MTSTVLLCRACRHALIAADRPCPECGRDSIEQSACRRRSVVRRLDAGFIAAIVLAPLLWFEYRADWKHARDAISWLHEPWPSYSTRRAAVAATNGKAVAIFFDAEWVSMCCEPQYTRLRKELPALLRSAGCVPLRVDLTGGDPQHMSLFKQAGVLTVPVIVTFDASGGVLAREDPAVLYSRLRRGDTANGRP